MPVGPGRQCSTSEGERDRPGLGTRSRWGALDTGVWGDTPDGAQQGLEEDFLPVLDALLAWSRCRLAENSGGSASALRSRWGSSARGMPGDFYTICVCNTTWRRFPIESIS